MKPGALRIYSFGENGLDDHGRCSWSIEEFEGKGKPEHDDTVFFVPAIGK